MTVIGRARSAAAVAAAPEDRLPLLVTARLGAEILLTYAITRWRMPRSDIRMLVRRARLEGVDRAVSLPASSDPWRVALRLGNAVSRTLEILPTDSRCLVQSLVLSRLLSARGISSQLVIGARSSPEFEAHAWIEHEGRPVLPTRGFHSSRLLEL